MASTETGCSAGARCVRLSVSVVSLGGRISEPRSYLRGRISPRRTAALQPHFTWMLYMSPPEPKRLQCTCFPAATA